MSDLYLVSRVQFNRIRPYFPLFHGIQRLDNLRAVSGIIYVIKHGLQWKNAPIGYGPHKTLYNCFIRWSRTAVFSHIFSALAGKAGEPDQLMIPSHRYFVSLAGQRMQPTSKHTGRRPAS